MRYISTRNEDLALEPSAALLQGPAPDGGLLVPEELPEFTELEWEDLKKKDFPRRMAYVLAQFFPDLPELDLEALCRTTYTESVFAVSGPRVERLNPYRSDAYILDLSRGPAASHHDYVWQLLPGLWKLAARCQGETRGLDILAGPQTEAARAALLAPWTEERLLALYPAGKGRSLPLVQEGINTLPDRRRRQEGQELEEAVPGGGEELLSSESEQELLPEQLRRQAWALQARVDELGQQLCQSYLQQQETWMEKSGRRLSLVDSRSWIHIAVAIALFCASYAELRATGELEAGEALSWALPSIDGSLVLAAFYAQQMGLPTAKIICSNNQNNSLADFFHSGVYSCEKALQSSSAPESDRQFPENLERLLFFLSYQNGSYVTERMEQLAQEGQFRVGPQMLKQLQDHFVGAFGDERSIGRSLPESYDHWDRVLDPHSALVVNAAQRYRRRSGDSHKLVYCAAYSPFLYAPAVCQLLWPRAKNQNWSLARSLRSLARESGLDVPAFLLEGLGMQAVRQLACRDAYSPPIFDYLPEEVLEEQRQKYLGLQTEAGSERRGYRRKQMPVAALFPEPEEEPELPPRRQNLPRIHYLHPGALESTVEAWLAGTRPEISAD